MYKCLLIETQELKNTIKELREQNRNLTKELSQCKNTINDNNEEINYYMIKLKSLTCKYNTMISENRNYARSLTTKSFSFETDNIEDLRELDGIKIIEDEDVKEDVKDEIVEDVQENKELDEVIEELKTFNFKKKNSKKKFPLDLRNLK